MNKIIIVIMMILISLSFISNVSAKPVVTAIDVKVYNINEVSAFISTTGDGVVALFVDNVIINTFEVTSSSSGFGYSWSLPVNHRYHICADGNQNPVCQDIVIGTPAPTPSPSPTPTPTPSPTPTPNPTPEPTPTSTPTPSPTPSPSPTPNATATPVITSTVTATPTPTAAPTQTPSSSSHGGGNTDVVNFGGGGSIDGITLFFKTEPKNAKVYINKQYLGFTDTYRRGLPAGRYRIDIIKEGFINFSKDINLDNGENETIDILLQPVQSRNDTIVSMSAYNNQSNDTTNDTVIVMPPATNNGNLPSFAIFAIVVIFAIGALIVFRNSGKFGLTRGKSIDTRIDTDLKEIEDKEDIKSDEQIIASLLNHNPDIAVADISDRTGIPVRTIYRRINEMKKDNRLPS